MFGVEAFKGKGRSMKAQRTMGGIRRLMMVGLVGFATTAGGCCWDVHYSRCGGSWHSHGCGDGNLIFLGVLGIAWGISAIAQACR